MDQLRAYTHLHHSPSILVTDWDRVSEHRVDLTTHWPSGHEKWPYDPRLLTQTIRQTGLLVGHAERNVPLTHQTLLHHLNFTVRPGFRLPHGACARMDVEVTLTDGAGRRPAGKNLALDFRISHQGETVARADSVFGWVSPAAYRRLRGDHLTVDWGRWPVPPPVEPAVVGRPSAADVMLSATDEPRRWQVRNDAENLLLFDHPVDHVPGLTLLEAAQQAAHATVIPGTFEPTGVAVVYQQYVEFDRPSWIVADTPAVLPGGEVSLVVTGVQDDREAFRATFTGRVG
ncbi:ScbA/BarX family gamma-butyrolactone biosynthesis protein [Streptomyces sp. CA-146814]|uniref:ScbA/BarX family gamma-butyrolactone biosynthesis protein n=1 Tax=Streptomyces sp. CA-146814 TaxID=3240053 RepID=UPI003D8FFB57